MKIEEAIIISEELKEEFTPEMTRQKEFSSIIFQALTEKLEREKNEPCSYCCTQCMITGSDAHCEHICQECINFVGNDNYCRKCGRKLQEDKI